MASSGPSNWQSFAECIGLAVRVWPGLAARARCNLLLGKVLCDAGWPMVSGNIASYRREKVRFEVRCMVGRIQSNQSRPSIAWAYRTLASASKPDSQHPAWFVEISAVAPERFSAGEPATLEEKMAALQAVLFLAKEPLSSRKLSQYANLADGTEARTLVTRWNRSLDENRRAFQVEMVAGGYQLVTRPAFAKWLRRLDHIPGNTRLSAPAMETLAVVAYRQPVLRAEVEAIRGVACGEMLSQLLQRDLVRISGRSEELGRPYLYGTTKRFLLTFGLKSLDELPRAELFREQESDWAKKENGDVVSDSQSEEATEANRAGISEEN